MEDIVRNWKSKSQQEFDINKKFLNSLRKDSSWDNTSKKIHHDVFNEVDCLKCANCCLTTPAIVTKKDAKRIAAHLKMTPKSFIKKYLIDDMDGDLMINGVPCTFLNKDYTCRIYEVRPKACREYPHTDQIGFHKRPNLNAANTIVCPATFEIVQRLRRIANTSSGRNVSK